MGSRLPRSPRLNRAAPDPAPPWPSGSVVAAPVMVAVEARVGEDRRVLILVRRVRLVGLAVLAELAGDRAVRVLVDVEVGEQVDGVAVGRVAGEEALDAAVWLDHADEVAAELDAAVPRLANRDGALRPAPAVVVVD